MRALGTPTNQPRGLLAVLADSSGKFGDRHDAAMDLGAFDEPEVEAALLAVASEQTQDPDIADAARESLRQIWLRQGKAWPKIVASMHPEAKKFFLP